jgi:hypothetical protein
MNLPSKGISVVIEKNFKGLICQCGNNNPDKIVTQEEVISKGKDVAGKWFEKKRKFLTCLSCGEKQIIDEVLSKQLDELETARQMPEIVTIVEHIPEAIEVESSIEVDLSGSSTTGTGAYQPDTVTFKKPRRKYNKRKNVKN